MSIDYNTKFKNLKEIINKVSKDKELIENTFKTKIKTMEQNNLIKLNRINNLAIDIKSDFKKLIEAQSKKAKERFSTENMKLFEEDENANTNKFNSLLDFYNDMKIENETNIKNIFENIEQKIKEIQNNKINDQSEIKNNLTNIIQNIDNSINNTKDKFNQNSDNLQNIIENMEQNSLNEINYIRYEADNLDKELNERNTLISNKLNNINDSIKKILTQNKRERYKSQEKIFELIESMCTRFGAKKEDFENK